MAARILLAINLGLDGIQDYLPFQVLKVKRIGFRLRVVSKFKICLDQEFFRLGDFFNLDQRRIFERSTQAKKKPLKEMFMKRLRNWEKK